MNQKFENLSNHMLKIDGGVRKNNKQDKTKHICLPILVKVHMLHQSSTFISLITNILYYPHNIRNLSHIFLWYTILSLEIRISGLGKQLSRSCAVTINIFCFVIES